MWTVKKTCIPSLKTSPVNSIMYKGDMTCVVSFLYRSASILMRFLEQENGMECFSEVVIVGAGAAGMLCGGILAERGMPVTILEKNTKPGKKLAATGNGRCNFTNLYMDTECYYGDARWLRPLLAGCTPERVIHQFQKLGVYHRERDGYVYPHTNQASTVTEALQGYCHRGVVKILTDCMVSAVKPRKGRPGYIVQTSRGKIECHYLVIAAGGCASASLGGSGSGYKLARSLGHSVHKTCPALTGLVCGGGWWKKVAGTRIQGSFSLRIDGRIWSGETGEIQIVKDGVSGIPVFQLCHVAAAALDRGQSVEGIMDFVPLMGKEELCQWVAEFGFSGLVQQKWIPVLNTFPASWQTLKEFTFPVTGTFGMERAQVTGGGIPTEEVVVDTMESKIAKGVYFIGEILDIDGKCGGYNLHFAWSSAMTAADAILHSKKGR